MLAVHRHRQNLGRVSAEPLERAAARGFGRRVTGDGSEHPGIGDAGQRTERHDFPPGGLRNLRQRAAVRQRVDRLQAVGLGDPFERLDRDVAQHGCRLPAHRLVAIGAGNRTERRRVHQLRDRGAPHADVLVLARHQGDDFALLERDLFDVGETNRRIWMLVSPLCSEAVDQRHGFAPAWPGGQLVTVRRPSLDPGAAAVTR